MALFSRRSRHVKNVILETERRASELKAKGMRVVKLNRGDPPHYFPTPKYIIDAYVDALRSGKTTYSRASGEKELKDAILSRYKYMYDVDAAEESVIVTAGVSEALLFLNNMLIDHGDRAVFFRPYYAQYSPRIRVEGGSVIEGAYDFDSGWSLNLESLEKKLKRARKGIKYMLLTNPNNPTGAVTERKELERLVQIANEHDIILVSDEIYDEIIYNGTEFTSLAQVAKGVPHIILNGISKNYLSTGLRVGFMLVPGEDKVSARLKQKLEEYALVRLCINTPSQHAAAGAIGNIREHTKAINALTREIEKRVNFATDMLMKNPSISVVRPKGSFYIFPKMDFKSLRFGSDKDFIDTMLEKHGIQLTRGSGFGEPSHFRIVALPPKETLEYAIGKINEECASRQRGGRLYPPILARK